jgi:hypothetical protein
MSKFKYQEKGKSLCTFPCPGKVMGQALYKRERELRKERNDQ